MNKEISSRLLKSIDDYVNGKLSPEEMDELWVQLLKHPEYYPIFKTEAALRKIDPEKIRPAGNSAGFMSRIGSKRSWSIAIAALLILAIFANLYRGLVETPIDPVITEIGFLHLISPDVTRASEDSLNDFELALNRSFQLSVSGNMEEAISIYLELLDNSEVPQKQAILKYNLGISFFNTGDYVNSAYYFQNASCPDLINFAFIESCYWLRTNSYLAIRDYERAQQSAVKTLEMDGSYRKESSDLLQKLQSLP